ncbi:Protein kinase superfamily protein [Klebsormidium nitens]|uniref:Protein kinase superfamily protein n=1 Tax=Klebsormidium nitens TaxID=105231 RepID=A0A1Y1IG18_KLENI|nr:Protein kinase superfamily protein [Klebsormidium nitens]|eukprot:GAQ89583.1 Protein kinase superfamily protein [Klebsormidium nitens]
MGLICLGLLGDSQADYVETAPRPGAPSPPLIPPGSCPLTFLQSDMQHAKQGCSSASINLYGDSPTSCCGHLQALLFQSRVRYANETGRLLLPQASADACIQVLDSAMAAIGVPYVRNCSITSQALSEDTGKACGDDLTTVYDFWSAANHTFPGTVGITCYGTTTDCSVCTSSITSKIMSLGSSTTALLSTSSCQALAQVAMTAAAYPLSIANRMSQCLHGVDISPIVLAKTCTAFDWKSANFTSVALSCGQNVRADRCCNLVLGMYGQQQALYMNRTGRSENQDEVEACAAEFQAALTAHGIPSTVVNTCRISATNLLFSVGCYNYTTILQRIPVGYYRQLETACNPSTSDCSQCKPTFFSIGAELANTTSVDILNSCMLMFGNQFFGWFPTMEEITARLNCYYQFPPGLQLGLPTPRKDSGPNVALIAGLTGGIVGALVLLGALIGCYAWRRFPPSKARWNAQLKTLSRISSLRMRAHQKRLVIYSRWQLRRATRNFDASRLLGSGGSGKVFVGELGGETVAIKEAVFTSSKDGAKEAWNEIATLARCRHRNLVILKGCCMSGSHCSLVYEYMEQGSLEDHLYEPAHVSGRPTRRGLQVHFLDWPTRLKIATGTANGLAYLHDECEPKCIHRDVKPSNILLTTNFDAKLSDFGLAKLTNHDDTHVTTGIAGTWGYLSPEYMATGQLTEKSDMYSFGVVLLTLVAGRRPTKPDAFGGEIYLPEWAWVLAERNELGLLVDPRLDGERIEHIESIDRMTRVALLCVHANVSIRPTARQCADMLANMMEVPPLPRRPMTLYTIASIASSESGSASMIRAPHQLAADFDSSLGTSDSGGASFVRQ